MIRAWAVCVAMVFLAGVVSADDSGWDKFTSKEGGFTVSFPGAPKEMVLKADGETVEKNVRFHAKRDEVDYDVGYIAYTKKNVDKFDALDPEDFARRQREATVKRTKGEILMQQDVTFGKENRPGYELLIQVSPKGFIRQRAFYVKGKLYQLMIMGTSRGSVTTAVADKFMDSFGLAE